MSSWTIDYSETDIRIGEDRGKVRCQASSLFLTRKVDQVFL